MISPPPASSEAMASASSPSASLKESQDTYGKAAGLSDPWVQMMTGPA